MRRWPCGRPCGDDAAFAELARRYAPLLAAAARRVPDGQDRDDARQEALIGLFEACRATDGLRPFAGIARLGVRWQSRERAATRRPPSTGCSAMRTATATGPAARSGDCPRARTQTRRASSKSARSCASALRENPSALVLAFARRDSTRERRHSAARVAQALALIADGRTITEAAAAVGASYSTVNAWVSDAPADSPARRALAWRRAHAPDGNLARRFSDDQRQRAVTMLSNGSSLRAAAAAVGASSPTVLRWRRQAA